MLSVYSCASSCADVARGTRTGHALISVLTRSSRPFLCRPFLCCFFCVACMSTHGRSGLCQAASASSLHRLRLSFPAGCTAGGSIWNHEDAEDVSYTLQAEIHTGRLFTFTEVFSSKMVIFLVWTWHLLVTASSLSIMSEDKLLFLRRRRRRKKQWDLVQWWQEGTKLDALYSGQVASGRMKNSPLSWCPVYRTTRKNWQ